MAKLGAQLFTLRDFTKTRDDLARTLEKVKAIGYPAVQVSAIGKDIPPAEVAQLLKDNGLDCGATHMGWGQFQEDLDTVIETHQMWGCKHSAIGGLPGDYFSLEGVQKFIDELGPMVERLQAAGMTFSYHNHSHEFRPFDGKTWLARVYEGTAADQLKAELDVYWVTAGGGDPAAWIRQLGARQPLVHLKDMTIAEGREQRFAPVGEGNLNWPAILEACKEVGVEYYLVEQDNCYDGDPFACLESSYRFLRAQGLQAV